MSPDSYGKKLFLLILIFMSSCNGDDQTDQITATFFDKYKNEDVDSAIDYLFSTNKWINESKEEISRIKINLNDLVKDLGKYYGYEKISTENINKNLKQYTFQLRYDLQPLRFKITFYKPNDEWRVQNFQYDSKLVEDK